MICLRGGERAGGGGGGKGRGRPRAGRLLPIGSVGGVDADSAGDSVSRRAAQTRRWPGASSAQLAARAGGQARPGQGQTPGVGHAPPEWALRPPSGPRAVRLGQGWAGLLNRAFGPGWAPRALEANEGGSPKLVRDVGGGPGPERRSQWVGVGVVFSATPLEISPPAILYGGERGGDRGSRACVPPPSGRKWSLCARGGLWSGLFHLLPLESVFYSVAPRGVGAPGGEGSSLATLPSLDGLFIKCRLWGRKGPLEGTPRGPRPGWARPGP